MLVVSEHFYSIQGEGKYIGYPAVFLRLGGCNLKCGFGGNELGSKFVCDTKDVWTKGKSFSIEKLIELFNTEDYILNLLKQSNLVVTGGEPLLQQKQLFKFLKELNSKIAFYNNKGLNAIEIETNGTIPLEDLGNAYNEIVDKIHWNISPKLSTSGESEEKRKLKLNLSSFEGFNYINPKGIYKFVITCSEDLKEINHLITMNDLNKDLIYLMPAGETNEEIEMNLPFIANMSKRFGYKLSTRLHLHIWNKKTGV